MDFHFSPSSPIGVAGRPAELRRSHGLRIAPDRAGLDVIELALFAARPKTNI
jgi:hypothetical protein